MIKCEIIFLKNILQKSQSYNNDFHFNIFFNILILIHSSFLSSIWLDFLNNQLELKLQVKGLN